MDREDGGRRGPQHGLPISVGRKIAWALAGVATLLVIFWVSYRVDYLDGTTTTLPNDAEVAEVLERIGRMTDCDELQAELDLTARNQENYEDRYRRDLAEIHGRYVDAANDRMADLECDT